MKYLTSGFACNIYITVSKFVDYYSRWHIIAKNTFSQICCCRHKQTCIKKIYVCTACIWCATLYSLHLPVVPSAVWTELLHVHESDTHSAPATHIVSWPAPLHACPCLISEITNWFEEPGPEPMKNLDPVSSEMTRFCYKDIDIVCT